MKEQLARQRFVAIFPIIIALTTFTQLLPTDIAIFLVKEHSLVELLSAAGYLVCAIWLIVAAVRGIGRDCFGAALLTILPGLRELDFHAMFTTMGVFKSRYYISPDVPLTEKLIVAALLLIILYLSMRFIKRNFKYFRKALGERELYAVSLAAAIFFAVLSKSIDSFSGPIEPLIALFHQEPKTFLRITEEIMELAIPMYLLLSISCYVRTRKEKVPVEMRN